MTDTERIDLAREVYEHYYNSTDNFQDLFVVYYLLGVIVDRAHPEGRDNYTTAWDLATGISQRNMFNIMRAKFPQDHVVWNFIELCAHDRELTTEEAFTRFPWVIEVPAPEIRVPFSSLTPREAILAAMDAAGEPQSPRHPELCTRFGEE